jgi:predicted PurR-regulated permease PerM
MSYLQEKNVQFWTMVLVGVIAFLWLFSGILTPFIVGFAVAYLLNPMVTRLERYRIPRFLSAIGLLFFAFFVFVIGMVFFIPVLMREMIDFVTLLPDVMVFAKNWLAQHFPTIQIPQSWDEVKVMEIDAGVVSKEAGPVINILQALMGKIFQGGMAIVGIVTFVFLMPVVAFYLLLDWEKLTEKVNDLMPKKNATRIQDILKDISSSLSGFVRGQLSVCLLLGLFYAIALSLLGLQYGFFIGVSAGVLSIIPYIGSLFGLVASVGMAFYQFGGWEYPLIALSIFLVGQLIEGNYLTPKLVGKSVGLHPLWVVFALMAGGILLGITGMIIAVPVAAILAVLLKHGIGLYKESSYYKGKGRS